jgi:hypothetical protein
MSLRILISMVGLAVLPGCSDSHSTSPADSADANATVRLVNATDAALDFWQGSAVVDGGSNLAFGGISPCTKVSPMPPEVTVTMTGTTANLAGSAPPLDGGKSYTLVAFPGGSGASFAALLNAFRPAGGDAGFRILNATSDGMAFDAFVSAVGAPLASPTTSNTAAGTASAFVNVAAGARLIRVTSTGTHDVFVNGGTRALSAGASYTLIVAPPASGTSTLRAFMVSGC